MERMHKGITVVVVEDDGPLLLLEEMILKAAGARVIPVGNSSEVIEKIEEDKPDVLFTDWMMPGMDGVEVIRAVKQEYPDIPAILTSCDTRGEEIAKQEGVEFLPKPFDIENLLSMVQRVRRPIQPIH